MKNDPYIRSFIDSLLTRTVAVDPALLSDWITIISWIVLCDHSELVAYLNQQITQHLFSDVGGVDSSHTTASLPGPPLAID